MKKTRKERLSLLLLPLLGFSAACSGIGDQPDMYGTPRADTRVQGRVSDQEGNAIAGIRVRSAGYEPKEVLTAADGSYDISNVNFSAEANLTFTDIDGPENGGQFAEKTLRVTFSEADRVEPGGDWNRGGFARSGIDLTLAKQPEEE